MAFPNNTTGTLRILAVSLADIGDLILTTPALSALRKTFGGATIHVLTTAHAAPILDGTGIADEVILFNKFAFDHPRDLLRPPNWREAWRIARRDSGGVLDCIPAFSSLLASYWPI